mgnify:CR=1 FL=1
MEEEVAHALYTELQAVDEGAKRKQGLGFAGRGAFSGGLQVSMGGWG